jgi:hypothetical protein
MNEGRFQVSHIAEFWATTDVPQRANRSIDISGIWPRLQRSTTTTRLQPETPLSANLEVNVKSINRFC